MYLEYFSLKRHPFRITPDPSLFFPGGAHGRGVVLDALVYGIMTGEGILKVVGEVGSGKTMLCRMLEEKLPANVEIVYLANPSLSARDIIYAIAFELKLEVDSATDRLVVMHKMQDYLLQRHAEGASVVVFIEEAQSMPLETLEEIRLLSNLETHRHKLMQIVLFGQPELDQKLDLKVIRQLRERITHSFYLQPLSPEEVREYLHFRLQSAGCPWPQLFTPRAEKLIAAASGGLTRRINILADKALLASYADPLIRPEPRNSAGEIQSMVLPRHVKVAIADSGYSNFRWASLLPYAGYGLAAAALLALAVVLWRQPAAGPAATVQATAAPLPQPEVSRSAVAQPAEPAPATPVQAAEPPVVEQAVIVAPPAEPAEAPVAVPETVGVAAPATPQLVAVAAAPLAEAEAEVAPEVEVESEVEVEVEVESESEVEVESGAVLALVEPEPAAVEPPRAAAVSATGMLPGTGLIQRRLHESAAWLAGLGGKAGYTIQVFAGNTREPLLLEELLEFLELTGLLEQTYICTISANATRAEQWLVLHGEFTGLSDARRFIQALPPYLGQYQPYTRNLSDIACTQ